MARKAKGKRKKAEVGLTAKDYRYPGESGVYWTGVGGVFILFVWIVIMFVAFQRTKSGLPQWQWVYLVLWPIGSVFLANFLSAKPRKAQLKRAGHQARVMSSNHPELFNLLQQQSQLFGLTRAPSLYVVDDDAAYIFTIPGRPSSILASKPLMDAMGLEEFAALLAREIGSISARNVRLGQAIMWLKTSNPLLKVLLLPVFLMSVFMRGWGDLTDFTADRAAVLLTGNESVVNLALVKLVMAQDTQADVSQEDLEAYLQGASDISTDSAQLERHFKIGRFIEDQPNLRERIEQLREYRNSAQGKAAFERLAQVRGAAG